MRCGHTNDSGQIRVGVAARRQGTRPLCIVQGVALAFRSTLCFRSAERERDGPKSWRYYAIQVLLYCCSPSVINVLPGCLLLTARALSADARTAPSRREPSSDRINRAAAAMAKAAKILCMRFNQLNR